MPSRHACTALGILLALVSMGLVRPALSAEIIDAHVHTAGIGAGGSGAFISQPLREGYKFGFYLDAFGVTLEELEREGDQIIISRLASGIEASTQVSRAVVLALDGVVDAAGALDVERTQVYVPNDFVAAEVRKHKPLLFGASINPYRRDALEQLEWAKANGAVLIKWIPGIMDIDPGDKSLSPFYRRMRALDLPLLTHGGQERAFGESNDALGDPRRLTLPLDLGVTVIVAHIASTGEIDGEDNFDRLLPMFASYPNLYADISSLTQINKRGYLFTALVQPELHKRLVYGSDWPLQFFPLVSPWYQWPRLPLAALYEITKIENKWDRDIALKKAMGVPLDVFFRSSNLLIQ